MILFSEQIQEIRLTLIPNPHYTFAWTVKGALILFLVYSCIVATSIGHGVVFLIKLKVIHHTNILKTLKETVAQYKRCSGVVAGTKTTPNDREMNRMSEEVEV